MTNTLVTCVCGHPKHEHDRDGMCNVDYLLCACDEYYRETT